MLSTFSLSSPIHFLSYIVCRVNLNAISYVPTQNQIVYKFLYMAIRTQRTSAFSIETGKIYSRYSARASLSIETAVTHYQRSF